MKKSLLKRLFILFALVLLVRQTQADWLVSSQAPPAENMILRYSNTGAFLGVFASGHGLADPLGMTFGPDGNLYVASANSQQVLRFHGQTGAFLGVFASTDVNNSPVSLTFGPDGNLYVSAGYEHIFRFNGRTGALIDAFVSGGRLAYPEGLTFGPDGNLYVVNQNTGEVLRYNGATGAFIDSFVQAHGLDTVDTGLAFGPDGNLYVDSNRTGSVFRYNGATGAFIDWFVTLPYDTASISMAFGPDRNLYLVTQGSLQGVARFNGQTGEFIDQFIPDLRGGLNAPWGIVYKPSGPAPTNHPPTIVCAAASPIECHSTASALALVTDVDGDALTVVWRVNGIAVQTNQVPANPQPGPIGTNLIFSTDLPMGSNSFTITVTDSAGNSASCSPSVRMRDSVPPAISFAVADPPRLWPPNHQMIPVTVRAQATDACSVPTWKITYVRSNESPGRGSDHTSPDWVITGDQTVNLRAEGSRQKQGRTYSIYITAKDEFGNTSSMIVPVSVQDRKSLNRTEQQRP